MSLRRWLASRLGPRLGSSCVTRTTGACQGASNTTQLPASKYEVSLVMILDQCDNQPSPSCFHADDRILTSVLHRQISTSLARCMVSTHREDFLPRFVLFLLPRESRDSRSYSKIKKYLKSRILTEILQSRSPVNFPQLASPRHSLLHHRVIVLPDSTFSFVDSVQGRDLKTTRILTTNPFSAASSAGAIAS